MLDARMLDSIMRNGYFYDLGGSDTAIFGISPREAVHRSSHQRLGPELAYEALENADMRPDRLAGNDTAVYLGVDSDDYDSCCGR